MLEIVVERTKKFIDAMPKEKRKDIGQFFTSIQTARFMARLFDVPAKSSLRVLDAGAGSGILSAAILERLNGISGIREVHLVCYETDENILPLLNENLSGIRQSVHFEFSYDIRRENYILSQEFAFKGWAEPEQYDLSIGNPPYKKIGKNAPEALAMSEVCHGAPNLYFLFLAMSLFDLHAGGEMVYIVPRSWTSGAYFRAFRAFFFAHGSLEHLHLFVSRDKVFSSENVLQETMILKVRRGRQIPRVTISSTETGDFYHLQEIIVPTKMVISGKEQYVYLVTTGEEVDCLQVMQTFPYTLPEIGFRMKTGLTVDFRERDFLLAEAEDDAVPMFFSQHIQKGRVIHPIGKYGEWLRKEKPGLLQQNRNYLFVKRFTAKEEVRRLQCGIYLAEEFPAYDAISTQNKLNFIDEQNHAMTRAEVYGLYALFNSSLYDRFYRILNGSTQVNSTEVNHMPMPGRKVIERFGEKLAGLGDLSVNVCDALLEEALSNAQITRSEENPQSHQGAGKTTERYVCSDALGIGTSHAAG